MDPTGSLEGLQNFLDTGGDVNYSLPPLFATESRTLLQTAASIGTSDMVALLLERGASLKHLTADNKSVVDLACDAENWDSFELLKNAADDQYPHVLPKPRKLDHCRDFFPSEFFFKLRNPFGDHYRNLRLVSPKKAEDMIEDMVQRTRKLKRAGRLGDMVPYPDENNHLISPYQEAIAVASMLQEKGENIERALAFAGSWLNRCLRYHYCVETRPFSDTMWPVLPKRVVDVSQLKDGRIILVTGSPRRAPYCALSYRWQDHTVQTTKRSLAAFCREIPLSRLPTQLQDAFLIANRLDINYVWVDALCIVQKSETDPGDFDEEAPKMASVYGNATLTITFTDNVRFGSVMQEDARIRSRSFGDLDTRGWVLQEQLLSQRVLYITRSGLFWECLDNSMSETRPCGIPSPSDGFQAIDDRKLKLFMLQNNPPPHTRTMLMCLWKKNIVEEYSRRHLTRDEDRVMAVASITSRLAAPFKDECLAGIWTQDAVRLLVWHTAAPCSRPSSLVFPSWSWYSVQGPVVYRAYTPFSTAHRETRGHGLEDDMRIADVKIFNISCVQEGNGGKVYRGRVTLRGLALVAYFASGNQEALYFPRRLGAEKELIRDLKKKNPRPARHDGGDQPEFSYIVEFPFVDTVDFPGSKGYHKVLCVIMGFNKIDHAFPIALVLEKINGNDEYRRVGTVAIDTRGISTSEMGDRKSVV